PSTVERSNPGTNWAARISRASTRPRARSSPTVSGGRSRGPKVFAIRVKSSSGVMTVSMVPLLSHPEKVQGEGLKFQPHRAEMFFPLEAQHQGPGKPAAGQPNQGNAGVGPVGGGGSLGHKAQGQSGGHHLAVALPVVDQTAGGRMEIEPGAQVV